MLQFALTVQNDPEYWLSTVAVLYGLTLARGITAEARYSTPRGFLCEIKLFMIDMLILTLQVELFLAWDSEGGEPVLPIIRGLIHWLLVEPFMAVWVTVSEHITCSVLVAPCPKPRTIRGDWWY